MQAQQIAPRLEDQFIKHDLTLHRSSGTRTAGCGTTGSTNTIGWGNNARFLSSEGCSNSKAVGGVSSSRILRLNIWPVFSSLAVATPDVSKSLEVNQCAMMMTRI